MNFFVKKDQIKNEKIFLTGSNYNHIKNVLRAKENEELNIVCPENNLFYVAVINNFYEKEIECDIIMKKNVDEEKLKITIYQALPKSDKMELIVQKCSEIGVDEIVPVEMKRCVVKLDEKDKSKKITRWQTIAEAAAKQSRREKILKIDKIQKIDDICKASEENKYDLIFVAYEKENKTNLKEELNILKKINKNNLNVAFIIGPEGGFEDDEIDKLIKSNVKSISLGKRILRTETAPIVLSSILMYEIGDIGGNNGAE